ncbi:MAG: PspA/IM30 family protein [Erythrobacter sp.]|nr:PspA/IM30 family protein [Erythrobacter sp.]
MLGQFKRIGELLSSNVEALIDKATDPRKMLGLLRAEIEDGLVKLTYEKSRAGQRAEAAAAAATRKAAEAEEWTGKARLAMDKGREDLARAALLARESERAEAAQLEADAAAARAEVDEITATMAELERRRTETQAQLDALPAPAAKAAPAPRPSSAARQRSRIDDMELRTGFAAGRAETDDTPDPAQVAAQFAAMERDSAIDAELAAMRPKKRK